MYIPHIKTLIAKIANHHLIRQRCHKFLICSKNGRISFPDIMYKYTQYRYSRGIFIFAVDFSRFVHH